MLLLTLGDWLPPVQTQVLLLLQGAVRALGPAQVLAAQARPAWPQASWPCACWAPMAAVLLQPYWVPPA
jgi:hypothetical protein